MQLGSSNDGPPEYATEAYPNSQRKLVTYGVVAIILLYTFRNAGSSDYRTEARDYLREHGREHMIDSVIPRTSTEYQMEKTTTIEHVAQLRIAMAAAQRDIQDLQGNVTLLIEQQRSPHRHSHEHVPSRRLRRRQHLI